jgi:hypothetical protein
MLSTTPTALKVFMSGCPCASTMTSMSTRTVARPEVEMGTRISGIGEPRFICGGSTARVETSPEGCSFGALAHAATASNAAEAMNDRMSENT